MKGSAEDIIQTQQPFGLMFFVFLHQMADELVNLHLL
jgi:hypothetical protein